MSPTSAVITPTCTTAVGRAGPDGGPTSRPKSASASSRLTAGPRRCSMTGSKRTGLVVQERDRQLLSELAVMRIIDREMTKLVAGFNSTRRANARLLQLTRTGLLRRFFVGSIAYGRKAVYTLSPKGGELVAAKFGGISRPAGPALRPLFLVGATPSGRRPFSPLPPKGGEFGAAKWGATTPPAGRLVI